MPPESPRSRLRTGRMCAGFVRLHLLTIVILTLVAGALLGNGLFAKTAISYSFGFSGDSLPLREKQQFQLSIECMTSEKFGWSHYFAERESNGVFSIVGDYVPDSALGAELRTLSLPGSSHWFTREELLKEFPAVAKRIESAPRPLSFSVTTWNKSALTYFLVISAVALAGTAILSEYLIRKRERAQGKAKSSV